VLAIFRMLAGLANRRAGLFGAHAKAQAVQIGLLVAFGLGTFGFLTALATLAIADRLGWYAALGITAGLCALGLGIVALTLRAERRRHEAALAAQAREDQRLLQAAVVAALPTLRKGGLLAAAAGVVALLVIGGRSGGKRD
jgi:uncharacterized membrane protein YbhN (UPF0104 family)